MSTANPAAGACPVEDGGLNSEPNLSRVSKVATHQDAIKRMKQNERRRIRNRHYRSTMRGQIKALREVIASGDGDAATKAFPAVVGTIHRIAGKGIIHRNAAARRVRRLNKALKALVTA